MSIQIGHVYAFAGGAFVGRFGGIVSSVVVALTLLYIIDPTIFNNIDVNNINSNINNIKEEIFNLIQK